MRLDPELNEKPSFFLANLAVDDVKAEDAAKKSKAPATTEAAKVQATTVPVKSELPAKKKLTDK